MKHNPRYGLYLIVALSVFISFFPIVWLILTSFKNTAGIYSWPPQYWPAPFTFENYWKILTETPELLRYVLNSFIVGLGTTLLTLAAGGLAGYALSRLKMRFSTGLMVLILSVSMFPPITLLPSLFQVLCQIRTAQQLFRAHHRPYRPVPAICGVDAGELFPDPAARDRRGGTIGRHGLPADFHNNRGAAFLARFCGDRADRFHFLVE